MASLHDEMSADLDGWGVLMDGHAESVSVQAVGDSEPRTIQAICRLDGEFANQGMMADGKNETLFVGCDRDAVTGIAEAKLNETKLWYDDDERPFSYSGQQQNVRADRWTLVFKRKRQERQGARE